MIYYYEVMPLDNTLVLNDLHDCIMNNLNVNTNSIKKYTYDREKEILKYTEDLYNSLVVKYIKDNVLCENNDTIYVAFIYDDYYPPFRASIDFPHSKLKDLIRIVNKPYCFIKVFHNNNDVEFMAFDPSISTIYKDTQTLTYMKYMCYDTIQLDVNKLKNKFEQVLKKISNRISFIYDLNVLITRIYFGDKDASYFEFNLLHYISTRDLFNGALEYDINNFIKDTFKVCMYLENEDMSVLDSFYKEYPHSKTTKIYKMYDNLSIILQEMQNILQHEDLIDIFVEKYYKQEILSKTKHLISLQQTFNDFKHLNYSFTDMFTKIRYLLPTIKLPNIKEYVLSGSYA